MKQLAAVDVYNVREDAGREQRLVHFCTAPADGLTFLSSRCSPRLGACL